MSTLYIKVLIQSIPAIASFLLEFIVGEQLGNPRSKRIATAIFGAVLLIISYLTNMTITLTGSLEKEQTARKVHVNEITTLKLKLQAVEASERNHAALIKMNENALAAERSAHSQCLAKVNVPKDPTPMAIPEKASASEYIVPIEILKNLGDN